MSQARILLVVLVLAMVVVIVLKPKHRAQDAAPVDYGVEPAGLQPQPIYEVRSQDFDGGNHYLLRNLLAGPIQVQCLLVDPHNVETDPPLPRTVVLPALVEQELTDLRRVDRSQRATGSIDCNAIPGDPGTQVDA